MSFFKPLVLAALLLGALPAAAQTEPLKVVASFSILGDMARQIGGETVSVSELVGPMQDAHSFQPSPAQAKLLTNADLILINGLKFEGWMNRLIEASGTKAKLLVASAGAKARLMEEEEEEGHGHHHGGHDHDQDHDHEANETHEDHPHQGEAANTVVDPHAWQDPRLGGLYARNIAAALIKERPEAAKDITARLSAYLKELDLIDKDAREAFTALAPEKRRIITSHDAFGYMADAYGLTFLAPAGLSTEAEPSAADVARLIRQIKEENIKSLFIENMSDPRLIQQIAKDTGAQVGGKLYADALSDPKGEAPTYLALLRHNIGLLKASLTAP